MASESKAGPTDWDFGQSEREESKSWFKKRILPCEVSTYDYLAMLGFRGEHNAFQEDADLKLKMTETSRGLERKQAYHSDEGMILKAYRYLTTSDSSDFRAIKDHLLQPPSKPIVFNTHGSARNGQGLEEECRDFGVAA